ncbi:cyclase family protein [Kocuria sp. U4B]
MNESVATYIDGGAIATLTADHALRAAELIKTGRIYSLAVQTNPESPAWPGRSFQVLTDHIWVNDEMEYGSNKLSGIDDYISLWCGVATHLDGFGHIAIDGKHYGDFDTSEVIRSRGAVKHGIETVPPVATRGVLLDVAGALGVEALEPGYEITEADIDRTLERQGITLTPGNVVLIHTGTIRDITFTEAFDDSEPGIGPAAAKYLVETLGVVAIGTDNWACEVIPAPDPEAFLPVHGYLIRERGVHIIENVWTRDLAADKVYEFMFVMAAPKLVGAVQSPIHPIAIA